MIGIREVIGITVSIFAFFIGLFFMRWWRKTLDIFFNRIHNSSYHNINDKDNCANLKHPNSEVSIQVKNSQPVDTEAEGNSSRSYATNNRSNHPKQIHTTIIRRLTTRCKQNQNHNFNP